MAKKPLEKSKMENRPRHTVYIGRTIPGLPRYTIFANGEMPVHIAEIVSQNEAVKGLIVPLENLQQARKDVQTNGHILNFYMKQQLNKEG
jgi:hypothetical protein